MQLSPNPASSQAEPRLCPHGSLFADTVSVTLLPNHLHVYLPDYICYVMLKVETLSYLSLYTQYLVLSEYLLNQLNYTCNYNTIQSWLLITCNKQNSPSVRLKFNCVLSKYVRSGSGIV